MMNRSLVEQCEMLMLLRLCGFVINEHIEHLMTFNDWFPVVPHVQTDKTNQKASQLLEDATAETQLLSKQAKEHEGLIRATVDQVAAWLEKEFAAENGRSIALGPVGNVIYRLKDDVLLPSGARSVVDRTLNIFHHHGVAMPEPRATADADRMLAALQGVGLFEKREAA